jgi:hypothetical protein
MNDARGTYRDHSPCRKLNKRTVNQTSGPVEAALGLDLARGSVRLFRQLVHDT